jgi:parallel beta-helix repeat protein
LSDGASIVTEAWDLPGLTIVDNVLSGGGGIFLEKSSNALVQSNSIRDADVGIQLLGGSALTLKTNVAGARQATSGRYPANRVGILAEQVDGLTLTRNSAHHNSEGGIVVSEARNVTATGNAANYNGADGINLGLVPGASGSVKDNRADYNRGRGIVVSAGFTNLGGNHASGNALGQCVGLTC